MKLSVSLSQFILKTLFLTAFVFVLLVSLSGVKIVANSQHIGQMTVTKTEFGLSFYQRTKYTNYFFTGYNDYFVDESGARTAIVAVDQKNKFKTFSRGIIFDAFDTYGEAFVNYFVPPKIKSIFTNDKSQYKYWAQISGNTISIIHEVINDPRLYDTQKIGTTLLFSRDDVVFDEQGIIYTDNQDQDFAALKNLYGFTVNKDKQNSMRPEVSGQKIYIVNPNLSGFIVVFVKPNQSAYINKEYKLVELEEINPDKLSNQMSTEIKLELFENLSDLKKI